jgi:hypothetical protein
LILSLRNFLGSAILTYFQSKNYWIIAGKLILGLNGVNNSAGLKLHGLREGFLDVPMIQWIGGFFYLGCSFRSGLDIG